MRSTAPAARARIAGVLLLALAAPSAGLAYRRARARDGAHRFFATRTITYRVVASERLPSLRAATRRAIKTWRAPCARLSFREARPDEVPAILLQAVAPEDFDHPAGQAAHTLVDDGPRGGIRRAIISLNLAHPFTPEGEPLEPDAIDLDGVLAHELGHALGLDHTLMRGALMAPGVRPGTRRRRTLHADDRAGFCLIYPA